MPYRILQQIDLRPLIAVVIIDFAAIEEGLKIAGLATALGYNIYRIILLNKQNK